MNRTIVEQKIFKELANDEAFMRLKDDPIADKLLEALLKKDIIREHIEGIICPHPAYIPHILRDDDNSQLVTAARSEYIAVICDEATTTVYLAKL